MNEPTGYTALDLIGYTDKGDYSAIATYVKNDLANYGGTKWRCLVDDTTGVTPTEGVNWTVFVAIPADTTKQIIAPVEGATSLHAYAVGKQLIYNDTLYKVIAPIAVNDALVVDTNIEVSPKTVIEQVEDNASDISDLNDEFYDAWQENGAYNIAPCTLSNTTSQGVTYTVNSENIVTATWSSTPTGNALVAYCNKETLTSHLKAGRTYKLTGCPAGGSWSAGAYKYRVYVYDVTTSTDACSDIGNGATFTPQSGHEYIIWIVIGAGAGASGSLTFKPMITTDLNATYADFVPYAMTNRELTENKANKTSIAPIEDGATASQAYKRGQHFIKLGERCRVVADIALGAAFTLNTNYVPSSLEDNVGVVAVASGENIYTKAELNKQCNMITPFFADGNAVNIPHSGSAGIIGIAVSWTANWGFMIASEYAFGNLYFNRKKTDGTWNGWEKITTGSFT